MTLGTWRNCRHHSHLLFMVLAFLSFAQVARVQAASISVNSSCSLADAIRAANSDLAVGSCPAGDDVDTITLTENVVLSALMSDITSEITIEGAGFTIDGVGLYRIFAIGSGGRLTLRSMTLANADNESSDACSGGSVLVRSGGWLSVSNSAFTGNSALCSGGGLRIERDSTASVSNSTFSGNHANLRGGAIHSSGHLTLTHVTISGNDADSWWSPSPGVRQLRGSMRIYNSLINDASSCPDIGRRTVVNSFVREWKRNYWEWHCHDRVEVFDHHHPFNGIVRLGSLTGSPAYFPLQTGSIGLQEGDPDHCTATDQLGNARPNPAGTNCDLGAVEGDASPPTITPGPSPTPRQSPTMMMMMGGGQDIEQEPTETPSPTVTPSPTRDARDVPNSLQATLNENGVTLDWEAPSLAPDGYLIKRRFQDEDEYGQVGIVFAVDVDDPTTYTDDRVETAGTYEYVVEAIFLDGTASNRSDPVTVTVREEDLATPRATDTATATETPTATDTPTLTDTPTDTPTATVTDTPGPTLSPDQCSLSDRIIAANTDRTYNECPPGSGADRISLSGDVILSAALPVITSDITIDGAGYSISGNAAWRIFDIDWRGNLTLENITLKDGSADTGGAIYNGGTLTIRNSTLRDNAATFWGGALASIQGFLTVESSSFTGNSALTGGGIYSSDISASVVNSTFSANTAANYGGAIDVQGGNLTISHSTLYGNTSGGLNRSSGTLNLRNSIIAGSTGADCQGSLAENSSNYIEDGTCSPTLSSTDGAINLGALTGSPAYHPLQAGSPAIDAGSASHCPESDQAGTARPDGEGCDLGAYEKD